MIPAIRFDRVSKRYRLGSGRTSLREWLNAGLARIRAPLKPRESPRVLLALREVSFAVQRGQVLGIIGPNGAGKTTVLRLLSRVTVPTAGRVDINGRVSSLIELGAGFHPELSGRENVYLNGVILGLTRKQLANLFDRIIAFAELEQFVDMPVKRYSSGMYARLGFAVAAHVEPEILLVDEVLSVGDLAFQNKCVDRMRELRDRGTTIVFVSHNLHAVNGLCDRALFLNQGTIQHAGAVGETIQAYQAFVSRRNKAPFRGTVGPADSAHRPVQILGVDLFDAAGQRREEYCLGESLIARIHYRANVALARPLFSAGIIRSDGLHVCSNTSLGQLEPDCIDGEGVVELGVPHLALLPDTYLLVTSVVERGSLRPYVQESLASFRVLSSERLLDTRAYGVFLPDFRWAASPDPGGLHIDPDRHRE